MAETQEQKPHSIRLPLLTVLSLFLALVVFVVGSVTWILPAMRAHQHRIEKLEQRVNEMQASARVPSDSVTASISVPKPPAPVVDAGK